jgi:hypothetical protein
MLFMIIERFRDNDMVPIYKQVRDGGRRIPEGLKYLDSWLVKREVQNKLRTGLKHPGGKSHRRLWKAVSDQQGQGADARKRVAHARR